MSIFVFWGSKSQIWKFNPIPPHFWKILKLIIFFEWPQRYPSNEPSMAFQSICKLELCIFLCFGPQMPKYGHFFPDPWKLKKYENFAITKSALPVRFQQALNHYPQMQFSKVMKTSVFYKNVYFPTSNTGPFVCAIWIMLIDRKRSKVTPE